MNRKVSVSFQNVNQINFPSSPNTTKEDSKKPDNIYHNTTKKQPKEFKTSSTSKATPKRKQNAIKPKNTKTIPKSGQKNTTKYSQKGSPDDCMTRKVATIQQQQYTIKPTKTIQNAHLHSPTPLVQCQVAMATA